MTVPSTFESVLLAELNVGLPPTFFYKLIAESDDWSFVLKLHVIIECALTRLLEKRIPEHDLDNPLTFARKLQIAVESKLFLRDEEYQSFLVALNYLRNRFAHDAKYIAADLRTVFQELPAQRRQSILASLGVCYFPRGQNPDGVQLAALRAEKTRQFPRFIIHNSAAHALDMLSLAYFVRIGKDGSCNAQDFRRQLQDLLLDPAVIELQRAFTNWRRENGYPEEDGH